MRVLALTILLALAACSTPGTLTYVPAATVTRGPPATVLAVAVTDARDEKPNRVATIRGGYGNPIKVLDTPVPVSEVVQSAFVDALRSRGIDVAAGSTRRVAVVLRTLYGDQFMGRKAEVRMELSVVDAAGRSLYADAVVDTDYVFTFFDNGLFASIEDLRLHVQQLLDATIDKMIDKPGFRAALTP